MFWIDFRRWGGFGHSVFLSPIGWDLDLEALVCGIVIGACAMLLAIGSGSRIVLLAVAILIIVGVFAPTPAFDLITHHQELTVAVVTPARHIPASYLPK
jgi:hypothetical protein